MAGLVDFTKTRFYEKIIILLPKFRKQSLFSRSRYQIYFEKNWKDNLTLNAAMKLGLEALRNANDQELNRDAVEVSVIDADGYRVLDRAEVNKQIDRLKPLEE